MVGRTRKLRMRKEDETKRKDSEETEQGRSDRR